MNKGLSASEGRWCPELHLDCGDVQSGVPCDTSEQSRDTAGLAAAAVQEMRAKLREFRTIVESSPFIFCLFVRGERGGAFSL